jgi:predicted nucleic acid-binding protein
MRQRPLGPVRVVLDNDHVLAPALTGAADLIATGDKRDLLPLRSYQGIPIVSAKDRQITGYIATWAGVLNP